MPQVDGPWKKWLSYPEEKSWKAGGSDFRATDKQQTYSKPLRLPNIEPANVVQGRAVAQKETDPEPVHGSDCGKCSEKEMLRRCSVRTPAGRRTGI